MLPHRDIGTMHDLSVLELLSVVMLKQYDQKKLRGGIDLLGLHFHHGLRGRFRIGTLAGTQSNNHGKILFAGSVIH